jgi:hypothetical protein
VEKWKDFQQIVKQKKKNDMPITADLENILNSYNIMAAAYYGGRLHGADCHEVIRLTKEIFLLFQAQLLAVSHPDRCSSNAIIEPFIRSKIEAIQNCQEIKGKIELSHKNAKRTFENFEKKKSGSSCNT